MNTCPICGEEKLKETHGTFRMTPPPNIPGGEIEIPDATWEECSGCGESILTEYIEERLHEIRYQRLELLTSNEIKAVRDRAGLSQTAMAQFLGVGEKTYNRWESGRSIQNKSSDSLIRLADQSPELFIQLKAQRHPLRYKKIDNYLKNLSNLDGCSNLAIAAHGAELNLAFVEDLRQRLRMLAAKKDEIK